MSYPYDAQNFNRDLYTETFNYRRNPQFHDLMNRPEIRVEEYPDPRYQQMDQIYYANDRQRGYNRPQQIPYAPQRRAFNLNEEREYPSNQVTARIRFSHRQYTSTVQISQLRRSVEWEVRVMGPFEITVTGYPSDRDGEREFLRRVQDITHDHYAQLC